MKTFLVIFSILSAIFNREGNEMNVSFSIDPAQIKVSSDEALLLTPVIRNGNDSIELPAVGIYGRRRFYDYQRQGMITGENESVIRASKLKEQNSTLDYQQSLPFETWMNGAELFLRHQTYGCCMSILDSQEEAISKYFLPDFSHITPVYLAANPEDRVEMQLEGSAMIQFVVDRTEIKPDWKDNARELGKITHSIDTVKSDPDFTITEVWLKGFASPESPYTHNSDLARGRTESLKDYIQKLYRFEPGIIRTEFEPEDWAGLRIFVENSNIENREPILDIINESLSLIARLKANDRNVAPESLDRQEWLLKSRYRKDYTFLLQNAYPPLRHTEYRIKYNVRHFVDIDEIKRLIVTQPYKLTLNDFFLAANTYEPGTQEFNNVYDVAVRMYPDSEIANLNAANAALQSGHLDDAERFLAKAGSSVEADFSRGILLLQREEYSAAEPFILRAVAANLPSSPDVLKMLQLVK